MKHPYANALLDRVKDGELVPANLVMLALAQTGDAPTHDAPEQDDTPENRPVDKPVTRL